MKYKFLFFLFAYCINLCGQESNLHTSLFYLTSYSCYDCRDCNSAYSTNSVKGDLKREEKYIRIFCDGQSAGVLTLFRVTECQEESYRADFIDGTFRSESEAKSYIKSFATELCANNEIIVDGKVVNKKEYTDKLAEAERIQLAEEAARREKRGRMLTDFENGKVKGDTIEYSYPIRTSTVDKALILSSEWKIFDRKERSPKRLAFLKDGTYQLLDKNAPSGEEDETGNYVVNADNTISLFRAPIVDLSSGAITINRETYSFWEDKGTMLISSSRFENSKLEATAFSNNLKMQNEQLVGDWHLEVWNRKYDTPIDLVFRITEIEDSLIADLRLFQFQGDVYCDQAYADITISNGSFIKLMIHFDGTCCTGTQSEFKGYAANSKLIFGEFYNNYGKTTGCAQILWRTDVKAKKFDGVYDDRIISRKKGKEKVTYRKATQNRQASNSKSVDTPDPAKEKSTSFKTVSAEHKNLDNWQLENGVLKLNNGVASLAPEKKKNPVIFKSPVFNFSNSATYINVKMDLSKVKNGRIKMFIKEAGTEELKEVFSENISLSLEEINQKIRNFDITEELKEGTQQFQVKRIDGRKFRGKSIELIIEYKATGLSKSPIYIGAIN